MSYNSFMFIESYQVETDLLQAIFRLLAQKGNMRMK